MSECDKCGEHALECLCPLPLPRKWIDREEAEKMFPLDIISISDDIYPVIPEKPLTISGIEGYETFAIDNSTIGVRTKWIEVSDRLPENYQYVLVYASAKGTGEPCPISIARCFNGKWEMLNHSEESNAVACGDLTWYMSEDEITHWLELPSPPDGKWKNY